MAVRSVLFYSSILIIIAALITIFILYSPGKISSGNVDQNGDVESNYTGEVQNVKLTVSGSRYILIPATLKKDVPVVMQADLSSVRGCARDIVIAEFGVHKYVTQGDNTIRFTPTKSGTINIACSMNMYRGTFTVE